MANTLEGKKIAVLVADGFEQSELLEPRQALDEAGAQTQFVSPVDGKVKGWNHTDWGDEVPVDVPLHSADPSRYDALLLPGGVAAVARRSNESRHPSHEPRRHAFCETFF